MTQPIISVVIPSYNSEKFISKCLTSILKQTFKNFEIIVINDFSSDNSLNIIKKFQEKDKRVKIINNHKNIGAHNSRMLGVKNAEGNYIAFIDSDDYVDKNYLLKLYNGTENNQIDLVILVGHYQRFRFASIKRNDLPKYNQYLIEKKINNPNNTDLKKGFFGISQFPCYSAMKLYRKELLLEQPSLDIFHNDDVIMMMNLFPKVNSLKFINFYGYYYRVGGGSSLNNRYIQDFKKLFLYKKEYIKKTLFNDSFDAMKFLLIELKNCFYEYYKRQVLNGCQPQ